jgi:DNA-binding transcriptional ArsR family regulator
MDMGLLNQAEEQATYCRVFSNARRVLILWALGKEEMSVSDISSAVGASLQNTSQHLRLMKDRGILSSRRDGQIVYYRVESDGFLNNNCLLGQNSIGVPTLQSEHKNLTENKI